MPVAAVTSPIEVELKFLVPTAARKQLAAEVARGSTALARTSLSAMYLDTADRRLARHGMAWRLRREGRRWIQALKSGGANALERFEHEVVRPDASHDASEHAGTPLGDQLIAVLRKAHAEGVEPEVRFHTLVRRTARKVRTRGAVVEIAFDEGRLVAAGSTLRICEIEFELVSGSTVAMLALAERWRKRFGLVYEPHSKAERGDRLAGGTAFAPVRRAKLPTYHSKVTAIEAFGAVLDECLAQITRNAVGLAHGDPAQRVEHIHQVRVGIRRLRSALRSFRAWVPAPPGDLIEGLRALFVTLGQSRDSDVLNSGVAAELAKVGNAPPLKLPSGAAGPDPVQAVVGDETQRTFLAWIGWRAGLARQAAAGPDVVTSEPLAGDTLAQGDNVPADAGKAKRLDRDDAKIFHRNVGRRLRRWHERIVADWKSFDDLDGPSLHALRKRIKRQRYAVEFFTPAVSGRKAGRYLKALATIQDRMGELNDLLVASDRYQALVASDPAAWFALGWLTARIAETRGFAKHELGQLAKVDPPRTS